MSKEVTEWTAPKVRSTFIEYFREREHTVGKFLGKFIFTEVLIHGSFVDLLGERH